MKFGRFLLTGANAMVKRSAFLHRDENEVFWHQHLGSEFCHKMTHDGTPHAFAKSRLVVRDLGGSVHGY